MRSDGSWTSSSRRSLQFEACGTTKPGMATVPVRLAAHPALTVEQESLIRFEYFGNTAARVETSSRRPGWATSSMDARAAIDIQKQIPTRTTNPAQWQPWMRWGLGYFRPDTDAPVFRFPEGCIERSHQRDRGDTLVRTAARPAFRPSRLSG